MNKYIERGATNYYGLDGQAVSVYDLKAGDIIYADPNCNPDIPRRIICKNTVGAPIYYKWTFTFSVMKDSVYPPVIRPVYVFDQEEYEE